MVKVNIDLSGDHNSLRLIFDSFSRTVGSVVNSKNPLDAGFSFGALFCRFDTIELAFTEWLLFSYEVHVWLMNLVRGRIVLRKQNKPVTNKFMSIKKFPVESISQRRTSCPIEDSNLL